jgi:hypothetical protein
MEARDKRILIYAISLVLVIAVIINGSKITKIDIPGLFGIEFSANGSQPDRQAQSSMTSQNITNDPLDNSFADNPDNEPFQSPPVTNSQPAQQLTDANPQQEPIDESEYRSPAPGASFNLTGTWTGSDGSEYIIEQTGTQISFIEYGLWGITASGNGRLSGNELIIDYETSFGTIGSAVLLLAQNGRSMTGTANDLTTGASTTLMLIKE